MVLKNELYFKASIYLKYNSYKYTNLELLQTKNIILLYLETNKDYSISKLLKICSEQQRIVLSL